MKKEINNMGRKPLTDFDRRIRAKISNNLRRITHGDTQVMISDKTGIPVSTLSGYFNQTSTINADNTKKIAQAYGVKVQDIDPRYSLKNFEALDSQLTEEHYEDIRRAENAPEWATEDDLIDLKKLLESNQGMTYGDEEFDAEDMRRLNSILETIFWEKKAKKRNKE